MRTLEVKNCAPEVLTSFSELELKGGKILILILIKFTGIFPELSNGNIKDQTFDRLPPSPILIRR
jgi:hypothetical protein